VRGVKSYQGSRTGRCGWITSFKELLLIHPLIKGALQLIGSIDCGVWRLVKSELAATSVIRLAKISDSF
jgi:hypothetical protein